MNVLIRTDASISIGSGHVTRCLALAGALRDGGAEVAFASREAPGALCDYVEARGYPVFRLRGPEAPRFDLEETLTVAEHALDWIVVDHYSLGSTWELGARARASHILAIDDQPSRPHDCDLLLDQNFSLAPDRYGSLVPAECERLLGPAYALLREEFAAAHAAMRRRDGAVRRILVYFGSVDSAGGTLKTVKALQRLGRSELAIDVIVGHSNPRAPEIARECASLAGCEVRLGDCDMPAAMSAADLAIGAGGVTTWERCCLGLPSLILAVAHNQLPGSRDLGRAGYAEFLGSSDEVSVELLAEALRALLSDRDRLRGLSGRCATLVDGRGARRVASRMLAERLELRRAGAEDCEPMIEWRNAAEVRSRSADPRPITVEEHRRWYARKLVDPHCVLLIGELRGGAIGALRYDIDGDSAHTSIFLAPGFAGRGLGRKMLTKGSEWMRRHHPEIRRLVAKILEDNEASKRAFLASGYVRDVSVYRKVL